MQVNFRLIQKIRRTGWLFPVIVIFGFLAGGLAVWQSWLLSSVVSKVFIGKLSLVQVLPILRVILIVIFARVFFTVINEALAGRLAVGIKERLRIGLLEKINRLGPAFLKQERTGELATTALQGLDALDAYFSQFLPQILLAALLPLTILIVVFPIDLLTGVVFLVTAPLIPFFMIWIGRLSQNHTNRQWKALSRLGAFFLDTLQGLSTLMILGRSRDRAAEVGAVSDRYRSATLNVLKITFLSAFVLEMIATISTALVAVEIGLRLLHSRIEFQQAFFILLIAPEFYLPLRNLSVRYHAGMNGITAAGRIFELMDTPEKSPDIAFPDLQNKPIMASFKDSFQIYFEEVSYKYSDRNDFALKNIGLKIESGRRYAVVGESGAGKSTLAHLLLRFISPENGKILFCGKDIQTWDIKEWRRGIAWLPQQPHLFNTSLLENVRLYDESFTRAEVEIALRKAALGSFIDNLAEGMDTQLLENGARLSGGEARRVALARAFLKNAPLLVMDEPTAHLDLELEAALAGTISKLLDGRTSITIAHRLSTVVAADMIFVLRHGSVVEMGTHAEMISRNGEYARLMNATKRRD